MLIQKQCNNFILMEIYQVMFFIVEESKENILDFSEETVRVF